MAKRKSLKPSAQAMLAEAERVNGITQQYLRELFYYDTNIPTAPLVRKVRIGRGPEPSPAPQEWRSMSINRRIYMLARLVWIYHHGPINPEKTIRPIGDPTDYRLENLAETVPSQVLRGVKKPGAFSKYIGVSWHKGEQKYVAKLPHRGNSITIGYSDDEIEAAKLHDSAVKFLFPDGGIPTNASRGLLTADDTLSLGAETALRLARIFGQGPLLFIMGEAGMVKVRSSTHNIHSVGA